jgi:cytochrome d ubiquinol oxidase subunit II
MTLADAVAAILLLAVSAYAVLAGADFGGGVWDLFASGPRVKAQRTAIAEAMGPVWEANHVWLIFLLVGLFTAFPRAFAALGIALYLPFMIALLGIILRGAAFAFQAHGHEAVGELAPWGYVFGAASIVAPAFLGAALAAVAAGAVRANAPADATAGWISWLGLDLALLAVALCAYLAATYLMVETEADPPLQADFRQRAFGAAIVSGVFALVGLVLASQQAPLVWGDLTGRGLPLLLIALINGPIAAFAVWRRSPRIARVAVAAQMVFVLWAWAVGQWPKLVPPDFTIQGSAALDATLRGFIVTVAVGMLLLGPSLWLLYAIFKGHNPAIALSEHERQDGHIA